MWNVRVQMPLDIVLFPIKGTPTYLGKPKSKLLAEVFQARSRKYTISPNFCQIMHERKQKGETFSSLSNF